jgi:hypothetical protein
MWIASANCFLHLSRTQKLKLIEGVDISLIIQHLLMHAAPVGVNIEHDSNLRHLTLIP